MDNIRIEATERSPEIDFDFGRNVFAMRGESYPEDVASFFGPAIGQLEAHLSTLDGGAVRFDFELIYFNSSSAKILMTLFDRLDEAAGRGNAVTINWYHDAEDDTMEELGREFGEDLENAAFNLKSLET